MARLNRIHDVAYGEDSPSQRLDVYVPGEDAGCGDGPFPLVMFVHGGAWQMGDKYDRQSRAWRRLSRQGFVVASINHRLTTEAAYPACLQDCYAALNYLVANAEKYNIDPARVAVAGDSSGAHLALMTALADAASVGVAASDDTAAPHAAGAQPRISCVVAWFPPSDLVEFARAAFGGNPLDHQDTFDYLTMSALVGHGLTTCDDAVLAQASPINYLPGRRLAQGKKNLLPILVQHGDADTMVALEQSVRFVEAARESDPDATVEFDVLPGAEHCDPAFDTEENMARVKAFLLEHMG